VNVHLVGSIGLDSVEEIFSTVGRTLGRHLKRIPDGEVGPRRLWVSFQYPLLRSSPYLRPDPSGEVRPTNKFPKLCLAEGIDPAEVAFGELGYAREAKGSYLDFCAARERGDLPKDVRFQVCLPTPMGVIYAFCTARDVLAIDAAYEKAMAREVERICRAIPHQDLCIQWDFCHEMIILDGQPQDHFPTVKASLEDIMQRMRRISAAVPKDVELGVHLCYGDFAAKHINEPRGMGPMVEVANAMAKAIERPIAYKPHAGADLPIRRCVLRAAQAARVRGRAIPRRRPCGRRRRRHEEAHGDGLEVRAEVRHRLRVRHRAGAQA